MVCHLSSPLMPNRRAFVRAPLYGEPFSLDERQHDGERRAGTRPGLYLSQRILSTILDNTRFISFSPAVRM
jgi:hypothetical protein